MFFKLLGMIFLNFSEPFFHEPIQCILKTSSSIFIFLSDKLLYSLSSCLKLQHIDNSCKEGTLLSLHE